MIRTIIPIILIAVVLTNAANPDVACPEVKDALAKLILKFLENLRSHMSTGVPSMGIPPLDPLNLPETESFYVHKPYQVNVKGTVSNTTILNLSSFNVSSISTSLLHLQANMTFSIPYFVITGTYQLRGNVLSVIPLRGQGPFLISPSKILASVFTSMKIKNKRLQLTSMDFIFDFHRLFVKFQGLNMLNMLANRFGVAVYHKIEPNMHERIKVELMDAINRKLQDIPLMDLISMGSYECQDLIIKLL